MDRENAPKKLDKNGKEMFYTELYGGGWFLMSMPVEGYNDKQRMYFWGRTEDGELREESLAVKRKKQSHIHPKANTIVKILKHELSKKVTINGVESTVAQALVRKVLTRTLDNCDIKDLMTLSTMLGEQNIKTLVIEEKQRALTQEEAQQLLFGEKKQQTIEDVDYEEVDEDEDTKFIRTDGNFPNIHPSISLPKGASEIVTKEYKEKLRNTKATPIKSKGGRPKKKVEQC